MALPAGKLFKDADLTRKKRPDVNPSDVYYENERHELPGSLTYVDGIHRLIYANRIFGVNDRLCGKRYEDDNPLIK